MDGDNYGLSNKVKAELIGVSINLKAEMQRESFRLRHESALSLIKFIDNFVKRA